jgi:glycosyltransferase involved in cell wall biosynthesis
LQEPVRVLLIPSSDYLGHPFPQRHNQIFERLHDGKEFEVHVVRFGFFGKPKLKTNCVIHEVPFEVKVRSTAGYYLANAAQHAREILRIVRAESIDAVVAGNILPPLTYLLARRLAGKAPLIFDLQDYYPTSAVGYIADPQTALGKTLAAAFDALVRELARRADAVTVPGVALAQYARRAGARRVHLVPNGIAEHFLKPHDGRKVREELGVGDDELLVGYVGSVEFWLDLEPLLKALSRAKERKPAKMLIVGKHLQTAYPRKVEEAIRRYGLQKHVTWLGFVPHEEVPRYMAAIDLGAIPFNTANPTAWYAAPNKMWEYASQGDTVISTPIPEAVAHSKALNVRLVESSEDYEKAILEAEPLTQKERAERMARAVLLLLKRTWMESAKKFGQVITQTARKRP